ncbi:MAG: prepilin-type N-terminal cleavage/methylation domain-containing protein [Verrucomicrobiales bacterium]|nr:prepilin-type N-terminal cleavage/methylation domain-containing protein [Verrucomicrobiales bacterium]
MKTGSLRASQAGFSMVELMTVIGIMVVLAGLLVASLPGVQARVNRQKVEGFIAELEGGLSNYQIDHGIYPQNPPTGDRDQSGILGAQVLYKHLSGDWNLDGEVDSKLSGDSKDEKVYVPKLAMAQNEGSGDPRASDIGGYMVIDAYGNPIRYLAEAPNLKPDERNEEMRNPTYDLWSIADADPDDPGDEAKYITNWGAN